MTYPIAQRASTAWAHTLAALRSGLGAQITAINADLAARSQSWRVPEIGTIWTASAGIVLRAQEADLPTGIRYPQVSVVPGSLLGAQDASGRSGLTSLGVSVACYLDAPSVLAAQTAAGITAACEEGALLLALADLATACAATLQDPTAGVYSASAGIVQITASGARAPQIHQVPAPGSRASALWCALEYRLTLEETY